MMYHRLFERTVLLGGILVVLAWGALLGGCDTTVPVFKNSEEASLYFSLYGQVGPDGGTVRVERLRDSINIGSPPTAPETVTLTRSGTGSIDTLRREERRVEQLSVHNYWVPPLEPGETYRISVEGRQGNVTSVTVQVPVHTPEIEALDTLQYCSLGPKVDQRKARPVRLEFDSVKTLALAAVRYDIKRFGKNGPYRWTGSARQMGDEWRLKITTDEDLVDAAAQNGLSGRRKPDGFCSFCEPPPLFAESVEVTAVAAGPGWPDQFNKAQLEEYAIPSRYSNVQQGTGLVVGTRSARKTIPVKLPSRCCPPPSLPEEDETVLPSC